MKFYRTPFFAPMIYPSLVWRIPTAQKIIYLTFDDGPMPGPTDFVLDTLSHFKAKATFFCIGDNVGKYPQKFQELIREGHQIGNHTHNHLSGWKTKNNRYIENVMYCQTLIGTSTRLFRPPYGHISPRQVKALKDFSIVMWDVLSYDFAPSLSAKASLNGIIKATRPGSIVVFHDSLKAESKLRNMLPFYINHFANEGYRFEVIHNQP